MGTCDAFCEIFWQGQQGKTSIKKNSYSPDWDETFAFSFRDVAGVSDLTLLVSDFNRLTEPDEVGQVVTGEHATRPCARASLSLSSPLLSPSLFLSASLDFDVDAPCKVLCCLCATQGEASLKRAGACNR